MYFQKTKRLATGFARNFYLQKPMYYELKPYGQSPSLNGFKLNFKGFTSLSLFLHHKPKYVS